MTKALKDGNIDEATGHKHRLEERQRAEEKQRAADNKPWTPKYFMKEVKLKKNRNFSSLIVPHSPPAHSSALETPLGLYASEERPEKSLDIREWDTADKQEKGRKYPVLTSLLLEWKILLSVSDACLKYLKETVFVFPPAACRIHQNLFQGCVPNPVNNLEKFLLIQSGHK